MTTITPSTFATLSGSLQRVVLDTAWTHAHAAIAVLDRETRVDLYDALAMAQDRDPQQRYIDALSVIRRARAAQRQAVAR